MDFQTLNCLWVIFSVCIGTFANETNTTDAKLGRIVGGQTTTINEFPYQVSLRMKGRHFCGGSIIGERHIMTAAHCVRGTISPPYTNVAVFTGSSVSSGTSGKSHSVKRADVHPGYLGTDSSSYHNDIAILTLSNPITFDANQKKIDLPSKDVRQGESATITGWGIKRYPSSSVSPTLQKAHMKIIPSSSCSAYLRPIRLYPEQVCAIQRKGVGACSGDSGGPLSANNEVIGIASWVIPCGEGHPDVYTKVYAYKDWIKTIMAKN